MLAVLGEVAQQVLLIGKLVVELEVVQSLLEHLALNAVLVAEALVALLPAEIDEHVFRVVVLDPIVPMQHYSPNQRRIIARADVKLSQPVRSYLMLLLG